MQIQMSHYTAIFLFCILVSGDYALQWCLIAESMNRNSTWTLVSTEFYSKMTISGSNTGAPPVGALQLWWALPTFC
ncbi:hypothetical protein J3R30DRAFT_3513049 [Lentinula aciculospora]|uniref:Secreted protein n=1 Tax=Lentinula aciculospora TaxID=153920 RepID=A0A9W9A460_9AGAR|nr:hypothetical protein J3R30DRAFT_3513049 [Lentinula aciculospora]